jgi:hypothetical protein
LVSGSRRQIKLVSGHGFSRTDGKWDIAALAAEVSGPWCLEILRGKAKS